jgi:hypothetical protein
MAEDITDKMHELKAAHKRTAGLAVFALAAAGGLGYMFNLSPLLKPDFSEQNVMAHTQKHIEMQVMDQFASVAAFDARIAAEKAGDMKPGTVMTFNLQGGAISVDPGQARQEAIADINRDASITRTTGNGPAAGLGIVGLILAGAALKESRKLKAPAP